MKNQIPEYLTKADNVYRTRDYIVIQRIIALFITQYKTISVRSFRAATENLIR